MRKPFWIHEINPKSIFEDIKEEQPGATFWDIFISYDATPIEVVDTSQEWRDRQKELIKTIINTYFIDKKMNRNEIELFMDTLAEFSYPENERYFDSLDSKYLPLTKKIYEIHLASLELTEATFHNFIYQFEIALEKHNHTHLMASGKEQMIQGLAALPHYSEEKKQEIIQNYLKMTEDLKDESYQDDFVENEFEDSKDVIYPQVSLAFSDTFYGFNDAGNLSFEEQERIANEKFEVYKVEITDMLQQLSNPELQPSTNSNLNDAQWDAYFAFAEANLQAYVFDGRIAVWNDIHRVLYLSMTKEDKELPYEIKLGGMLLEDYKMLLQKYNTIVDPSKH
ncbi:hypothetical protein MHTCC0001_31940 [Flavobacteriaceae bacterium MHTCC 0001]